MNRYHDFLVFLSLHAFHPTSCLLGYDLRPILLKRSPFARWNPPFKQFPSSHTFNSSDSFNVGRTHAGHGFSSGPRLDVLLGEAPSVWSRVGGLVITYWSRELGTGVLVKILLICFHIRHLELVPRVGSYGEVFTESLKNY